MKISERYTNQFNIECDSQVIFCDLLRKQMTPQETDYLLSKKPLDELYHSLTTAGYVNGKTEWKNMGGCFPCQENFIYDYLIFAKQQYKKIYTGPINKYNQLLHNNLFFSFDNLYKGLISLKDNLFLQFKSDITKDCYKIVIPCFSNKNPFRQCFDGIFFNIFNKNLGDNKLFPNLEIILAIDENETILFSDNTIKEVTLREYDILDVSTPKTINDDFPF